MIGTCFPVVRLTVRAKAQERIGYAAGGSKVPSEPPACPPASIGGLETPPTTGITKRIPRSIVVQVGLHGQGHKDTGIVALSHDSQYKKYNKSSVYHGGGCRCEKKDCKKGAVSGGKTRAWPNFKNMKSNCGSRRRIPGDPGTNSCSYIHHKT